MKFALIGMLFNALIIVCFWWFQVLMPVEMIIVTLVAGSLCTLWFLVEIVAWIVRSIVRSIGKHDEAGEMFDAPPLVTRGAPDGQGAE